MTVRRLFVCSLAVTAGPALPPLPHRRRIHILEAPLDAYPLQDGALHVRNE